MSNKNMNDNTDNVKRIVAYARVSSAEQAENTHALTQQISRLEEAGAQKVFQDVISGQSRKRPGLDEMMKKVKQQEIDEVIIVALDRLGRTVRIIHRNIEFLTDANVNLRVLDQDIDLSTSHGRFQLNLLASLAELEVGRLGERVRQGHRFSRKERKASASVPFGWVRQDERYCLDTEPFLCLLTDRPANFEIETDDPLLGYSRCDVAKDCVAVFLVAKGLSKAVRMIFENYGVVRRTGYRSGVRGPLHWTVAGLRNWLLNPVHSGHTAYLKRKQIKYGVRKDLPRSEWMLIENTHSETLISAAQTEEITRIINFNAKRVGSHQHFSAKDGDSLRPFSYMQGLVFCASCGAKAITKTRQSKDGQKKYCYFACRHAKKGCDSYKGTPKQKMEDALIQYLVERSHGLRAEATPQEQSEEFCSERLLMLKARLAAYQQLDDADPSKHDSLRKVEREIREEKDPFSTRAYERKSVQELIIAGNSLMVWNTLPTDAKAEIFARLLQQINIRDGGVVSILLND